MGDDQIFDISVDVFPGLPALLDTPPALMVTDEQGIIRGRRAVGVLSHLRCRVDFDHHSADGVLVGEGFRLFHRLGAPFSVWGGPWVKERSPTLLFQVQRRSEMRQES